MTTDLFVDEHCCSSRVIVSKRSDVSAKDYDNL